MDDLLDSTRQEIGDRLIELRPAVEEYKQLEAAAAALDGVRASTPIAAAPTLSTAASAKSAAPKRRKRRAGRPRRSNARAAKAALASAVPTPPSAAPAAAAATPATKSAPATKRRRRAARGKAGARKRKHAPLSANQRAIIAALGHGAHSVKELVGVTAISDQTARNNLKGLLARETVVKTERGGKAAYALSSSS